HHFTSYEKDAESSLDYAMNRGYAPTLGRFQQADPYRASGYMIDPQSWNRYVYTRNHPINRVDVLGLEDTVTHDDEGNPISWPGISVNAGLSNGRGGSSGAGSGSEQLMLEDSGLAISPFPAVDLTPCPTPPADGPAAGTLDKNVELA